MRSRTRGVVVLLVICCLLALLGRAAESLPAKPAHYVNDYAGVISPGLSARLETQLREFEQQTSNQIVVAIYPRLESASSVQDYTFRIAEAWKVGQADRNNGAVLFVFTQPRKLFIQVGYGLEGALPDIVCKQIIEDVIKPGLRAGDFDQAISRGVEAMLKATRGEYQARPTKSRSWVDRHPILVFLLFLLFLSILGRTRSRRRGTFIGSSGRSVLYGGGLDGGWKLRGWGRRWIFRRRWKFRWGRRRRRLVAMKPQKFLSQLHESAIVAAIAEVETQTSGEIRVYVSEQQIDDAQARARSRFHTLGMDQTRERNAVLLYFAPRSRQFAIIGDSGIHSVCGQTFWEQVAAQIRQHLRSGQFEEAVLGAVRLIGSVLARHFPPLPNDQNQLPNELLRDPIEENPPTDHPENPPPNPSSNSP